MIIFFGNFSLIRLEVANPLSNWVSESNKKKGDTLCDGFEHAISWRYEPYPIQCYANKNEKRKKLHSNSKEFRNSWMFFWRSDVLKTELLSIVNYKNEFSFFYLNLNFSFETNWSKNQSEKFERWRMVTSYILANLP